MLEFNSKNAKFLARMGTRGTLGQAVYDAAKDGMDFFAISADVAYPSGFERFIDDYPTRFVNVGIAEQNMIGIAAGLSRYGTPVISTTWAMFSTMRAADQIRNYLGYYKSNIKLIGVDSGLTFSKYGYAHANPADLSIIRSIPNIKIVSPCDATEIYKCIYTALRTEGPMYIRLTGGENPQIIHKDGQFDFIVGKSIEITNGEDIAIIATGAVISKAVAVAELLSAEGISVRVIDMHTVKPLDEDILIDVANYPLIVTIEEHLLSGGFGSSILEYYSDHSINVNLLRIGVPDKYVIPGSMEYNEHRFGMDVDCVVEKIRKRFSK